MLVFCGCTTDKAAILFNKYSITEKNIYDYSKSFLVGRRISYVILMPKKDEATTKAVETKIKTLEK